MDARHPPAVPVGTLTDAELALLSRPRTRVGPRPVMPVWSRLAPDSRETAARQARAALLARRLLEPLADPGRRRGLGALLALRAAAGAVVAVVRSTPSGRDHWYAHLVGDVGVLEQVSADGLHRFALTAAATVPEHVAAAVLHGGGWERADVELRTATRCLRWAWGPATGRRADAADVRRQLRDALADLRGEVADAG